VTSTYTQQGGSIQSRRRELGLSRQELASRAGCSMSYLALIEGGFMPHESSVLPRVLSALAAGAVRREGAAAS
jgi:predicted transcriptional regulator